MKANGKTGHVPDYGYRYYDPLTGRWPSRDPIGEKGGVNIYSFAENDGVDDIDVLGEYMFSAEQDGLRKKVKDALETLTGSQLKWCKVSETKISMPSVKGIDKDKSYVLVSEKDGEGELWSSISSIFGEKIDPIILIKSTITTNAGGARGGNPRRLVIPENPNIDVPVVKEAKHGSVDAGRRIFFR